MIRQINRKKQTKIKTLKSNQFRGLLPPCIARRFLSLARRFMLAAARAFASALNLGMCFEQNYLDFIFSWTTLCNKIQLYSLKFENEMDLSRSARKVAWSSWTSGEKTQNGNQLGILANFMENVANICSCALKFVDKLSLKSEKMFFVATSSLSWLAPCRPRCCCCGPFYFQFQNPTENIKFE